ncbi:MAG: glycoside hydrolase family 31 protein [Planctomycetota bacterium]
MTFDGEGLLHAKLSEAVLAKRPSGVVTATEAGSTLADALRFAQNKVSPPTGHMPAERMFSRPQYNLWIELMYKPTQAKVLAYAHALIEHGFPTGVMMIDDNWSKDYGRWQFDRESFPDPKAMTDELHSLGFELMLWVCPFVCSHGRQYLDLRDDGLLLRPAGSQIPAIRKWWNGQSALLDLTHPGCVDWFIGELKALQDAFGIDGFKIDAGNSENYHLDDQTHDPQALPTDQTYAFGELGRHFDFHEVKASFNNGGSGLAQRLRDVDHDWSPVNGVGSLIPRTSSQAMTGYAYTCPDMIGGGEYLQFTERMDSLDPELFVRYAQIAACMPMMQFSAAPWRVLDEKHCDLCLAAAELHVELGPEILELARQSAVSGEPIVRPLEYDFPHAGYATVMDQYMLGSDLMVAPVVTPQTYRRTVQIPEGIWTDDLGASHHGPCEIETESPISRVPRYRRKTV